MTTTETKDILTIKATSGAKRVEGKMVGGESRDYTIDRDSYLALCNQIFTISVEKSKEDNEKSGGLVSQTLHSYGVTPKKEEAYEETVFPQEGKAWGPENSENWLEAMSLKSKRVREKMPLAERQAKWDIDHKKLEALGALEYLVPKLRPVK